MRLQSHKRSRATAGPAWFTDTMTADILGRFVRPNSVAV
jgi:hypothetical protein